jgi:hypothetical protein
VEGDILTIVGLVGVTLFISVGKWLNGLRWWLLGFSVGANPLKMLGELLSCTISTGFVVGAIWALEQAVPWSGVFIMGGFVSLAAYATDEALALMDAGVRKMMGGGVPPPMPAAPPPAPPMEEEKGEMTEDEAHAIIGGKDAVDE